MRGSIFCLSATSLACFLALPNNAADAAVGGPDSAGYTFADQDDGAVYNFVDISATGTVVINADDGNGVATLGAPFTWYGTSYNELVAGTNGILTTDTDTNPSDLGNACPLPDGTAGDSPRLAVLHDDLVTVVYYQYFDALEAAAIGYPGETDGISIIQWQGDHFPAGGDPDVDAQAILFHASGNILTMVAADPETGLSSTIGLQEPMQAATSLTYVCNTADSNIPGVTAVLYTAPAGGGPDSDCCSASAGGLPGCTDAACEASVCLTNPECCGTEWDAACAATAQVSCPVLCGGGLPPLTINEIRIDAPGTADEEFFELSGPPGLSLEGLTYIVIGDGPTGNIEAAISLDGQTIPPTGLFVVAEAAFTLGTPDLVASLNFENSDTVTHMLVSNFTGAVTNNIDADADGIPDNTPWDAALDIVAVIEDAPGGEFPYGPPLACAESPTCQNSTLPGGVAGHTFRCANGTGAWGPGGFDPSAADAADSPGLPNPCACGDGVTAAGEECDDSGESATCDLDCTAAVCGDGTLNLTAGEGCDDAGESATCDTDCTLAMCGDGTTNPTAGEDCDDSGESATCDTDCTTAVCGDGTFNPTSGEECDDGGESATCNDDCTPAACGDGIVNMAAGEDCDDGGESATCNADCTFATCGDGLINASAGEDCDDAGESATCDDDCTVVACGDGNDNPTAGEECDDGGESATCDLDCTLAMCGDTTVNPTAGENCDDGGRSATCNADCTAASCGDGIVNMTAGEECDGDGAGTPGETESCDDDCTAAMCGDGVANAAAGEDCDDAGESADCNDDCTAAACGDGIVNATAGEDCDDGNTDDGDGCSATCTDEDDPGTTGDSGDTGDTDGETDGDTEATGDSGGSGDSGVDDTAGDSETGVDPSAGSMTGGADSSGSGDTGNGSSGAVPIDDDGCSCSTNNNDGRGTRWSLLALFGLAAIRRRRRRA